MRTPRAEEDGADLVSHLAELRTRVVIGLLAVAAGMAVGWVLAPEAYRLLARPILDTLPADGQIITLHPAEVFFTRLEIAGVLGLVLGSPVVIWQLWLFVKPGLHPHERRAVAPILPLVCGLFLAGAGVAYLMLPQIMRFFQSYTFPGVHNTISFAQSIDFPLKILLSFGLAFELPVVLLGLAWLGILTPQAMLAQWRPAVVSLGVLAAVITPTGDPLTWTVMLVPLLLLYFGTVWLAGRIAPRPTPAVEEGACG